MSTQDNICLEQIMTDSRYDLLSCLNEGCLDSDDFNPVDALSQKCSYYTPDELSNTDLTSQQCRSYFHLNCQGLQNNWDAFHALICDVSSDVFSFDFIGVSELFGFSNINLLSMTGYHPIIPANRDVTDDMHGGVGLYIKDCFDYIERPDLSVFIPHVIETVFVECQFEKQKKHDNWCGVSTQYSTSSRH